MADVMHIKDMKTGQVFKIDPTLATAYVVTRDGVRVKLHPESLRIMVGKEKEFNGHTTVGQRPMKLL